MPPLRPHELSDGTLLLRSSLLDDAGVAHAFSTAVGPGGRPFDLSRPGAGLLGTEPDRLARDLRTFADSITPGCTIAAPRQVHGAAVAPLDETRDRDDIEDTEADAVAGRHPTRLAGVRTADCVPILIACPRHRTVAAVHAGWRGLVADIPGIAVRHLTTGGSSASELVAAIGPAIGLDAFEVGPEVADACAESGLAETIDLRSPKPHIDLHAAARRRLIDAGIGSASIDGAPICTATDPRFFSHRRDHGRTGRHLSAIHGWHRPA